MQVLAEPINFRATSGKLRATDNGDGGLSGYVRYFCLIKQLDALEQITSPFRLYYSSCAASSAFERPWRHLGLTAVYLNFRGQWPDEVNPNIEIIVSLLLLKNRNLR